MDKNNRSAFLPILLWLLVSVIMTAVFQAAAEKTGAFTDVDTAAAGAASALLIPAYVCRGGFILALWVADSKASSFRVFYRRRTAAFLFCTVLAAADRFVYADTCV